MTVPKRNECEYPPCSNEVDESGLLCRLCWRAVPKPLKEQYSWARKLVLKAVKAHEEIR